VAADPRGVADPADGAAAADAALADLLLVEQVGVELLVARGDECEGGGGMAKLGERRGSILPVTLAAVSIAPTTNFLAGPRRRV
jgi:hypothetical protein